MCSKTYSSMKQRSGRYCSSFLLCCLALTVVLSAESPDTMLPDSDSRKPTYGYDSSGRLRDVSGLVAPAGIISLYAGSTAPDGWLICDGDSVSRSEFRRLFAAIGITYGSGDGATTFNLPDMRGRAPIGAGTGTGLSDFTIGTSTGAETISSAQLPSHTHTVGTFSSAFIEGRENSAGGTGSRVVWDNGSGDAVNKSDALDPDGASHSHSLDSTSGTNNKFRTPELVVNFIIKT